MRDRKSRVFVRLIDCRGEAPVEAMDRLCVRFAGGQKCCEMVE